jgi:hypothetical protein
MMSGNQNTILWTKLARLSLAAQGALVSGAVAGVWVALAPAAYRVSGTGGLVASAAGAGVCLLGAHLALALSALFHGRSGHVTVLAPAMLARTLVPLVIGVVLHVQVPSLATSGMVFYLLVFYLVALATETVLLIAKIPPAKTSSKSN